MDCDVTKVRATVKKNNEIHIAIYVTPSEGKGALTDPIDLGKLKAGSYKVSYDSSKGKKYLIDTVTVPDQYSQCRNQPFPGSMNLSEVNMLGTQ